MRAQKCEQKKGRHGLKEKGTAEEKRDVIMTIFSNMKYSYQYCFQEYIINHANRSL